MAPGNNSNPSNRGGGNGGRGGGRSGNSNRGYNPGRGHGNRNSNRGFNSSKPQEKKHLFAPAQAAVFPKPQSTTYATYPKIVEHICQFIQSTFDNYGQDCAKSLRDGKLLDLSDEEPQRVLTVETETLKATLE